MHSMQEKRQFRQSTPIYEYILDEKERDARGMRKENEAYFADLMKGFKIRKSILARCDCHDLEQGEDGVLKAHFKEINRGKMLSFCRRMVFLKMWYF